MADDVLKDLIGTETSRSVITVERGHLGLFADAVKDGNAIYRDPRAAAAAGLDGIPAPPTYPFAMDNFGKFPELQPEDGGATNALMLALGPLLGKGGLILHGEQSFAYTRPVYAGDVLEGKGTIVDAYRKESKGKTMTFIVVETEWTDQETGEAVCTSTMNLIHRI